MSKLLSRALVAALALGVVACGGDDDDSSGGDGGDGGSEKREAYVDAIATVAKADDESFTNLTDASAQCVGEAYVDALGLETLEAAATPEEIRDTPSADHTDWGVEMTDEQGLTLYKDVVECAPETTQDLAREVASGFQEAFPDGAVDVDVDCLADADTSDLEGFIGAAIAQGDNFQPNDEQAGAVLDWMSECVDLRQAFVAAFASDPSIPAGVGECVSEALDDQFIMDFWKLAFTSGGDDSAMQNSPLMGELTSAMTTCAAQAGG